MFKLLKKFHFCIARRLLNVRIGVRLFALMGLAAAVALMLATVGIVGLFVSKESLRSVYEDRMLPVRQLADITNLMLVNRLLQQAALGEVSVVTSAGKRPVLVLNREVASRAADAIERNMATIDVLWQTYASSTLPPLEQTLAKRFAESRLAYVNLALTPVVLALRAGHHGITKNLAASGRVLYDETSAHLRVLNQRQFDAAEDAYAEGVRRYDTTRLVAYCTLGLAMLVMTWLGLMLTTSIVYPLEQVIAIFKKIAMGQYDSAIVIEGQDEISKVMLALQDMQDKLGVHEESIHQLAFYDALTRLPNRRLLRDRLQRAMSVSTRNHHYGAVLMIDLDNFKNINDTRGHDVGDHLLVEIALRIQSCVRQVDTVARLGGDEFIILLVDLSVDEAQAAVHAEVVGEKILSLINQQCMLINQLYQPSASMGVCLFLGQNATIEDLHKRADMSMYQAKSGGRNTLRFYDPQVQASLEKHIALETELRGAVAGNQLTLHYQIQVDSVHGVLGAEVLLRWERPGHGLVYPNQFISIAEESGLILPIGEWVLRMACKQLKVWESNPVAEDFLLSVNVSARQFRHPAFVMQVVQVLAETGINPAKLKLELTESLVLHNVADTIDKMKALNLQGVHFSMDDFGTGYSSLAHLTALPIQQLKIDRSFVRNIASNHNDAVIAQTIIGMAHNLGVAVIAEGVESEEQRACLERFGCPTYQGYLYGKPMPLKEFEELALQVSTI